MPVAHLLRVLVAPLVGTIVVLGIWVAGGEITDDFKLSVVLTAAWLMIAGGACGAVARSRRRLRTPVAVGYLATVGIVGSYLGWSTLHDHVVHERVVVGVPVSHVAPAPAPARRAGPVQHAGPVQLSGGRFRSGEHATTGSAAIVRLANRRLVLTLTHFRTSPGPDLRVRLVPGEADRGDVAGNRDLGALKGNIGDQEYTLPDRIPVVHVSVIIWCRAFSATFGAAELAPS
jgi:hypothetical protein